MSNKSLSTKRVAISKANAQMVALVAVASFISIFCLVAAQAVWSQNSYQAKLIDEKEKAHDQLEANIDAYKGLAKSYQEFDLSSTNIIGGSRNGTGDKDGSNSKIAIDALPSTYDFPGLTASLEKVLTGLNLKIDSISGIDDQLNQQGNLSSPNPVSAEMPFAITISDANYESVKKLITTLQSSIRPIEVDSMNLVGGTNSMTVTINAHTYYQPAKNLNITDKVVK